MKIRLVCHIVKLRGGRFQFHGPVPPQNLFHAVGKSRSRNARVAYAGPMAGRFVATSSYPSSAQMQVLAQQRLRAADDGPCIRANTVKATVMTTNADMARRMNAASRCVAFEVGAVVRRSTV